MDKPAEPQKTEIFSNDAELDNPSHIGIFTGDVVVVNPQFKMNCDKLFAYLRHDTSKDAPDKAAGAPTAPGKTPKPGVPGASPAPGGTSSDPKTPAATPQPKVGTPAPAAAKPNGEKGAGTGAVKSGGVAKAATADAATKGAMSDALKGAAESDAAKAAGADQKPGGLQKAIAEGNVVITQDKTDPNGNVEHDVAHAKKALYDTDTGDVTLYGKPDVQQGGNQVIALDETTIIILNRSGHMTVHGPHKVVLENSGSTASDSKNTNAR
jgi:lipopolysaccharide export system protein LptA